MFKCSNGFVTYLIYGGVAAPPPCNCSIINPELNVYCIGWIDMVSLCSSG